MRNRFDCKSIPSCFSLLAESKKYGTKAFNHTEVKEMKRDIDDSFIVETTNGTFTAKQLVNAAGVGSENRTNVGCKYPN